MEKRNEICDRPASVAEKRAGSQAFAEDVDDLVASAVADMRRSAGKDGE